MRPTVAIVRVGSVPPTGPLGPVAQDPDQVRTAVCKLVAIDTSCTPTTQATVSARPGASPSLLGGISALGWAALIVGLVFVLYVLARSLGRRAARAADVTDDEVDEPAVDDLGPVAIDRRREPSNWRREAEAHRRAGRYRQAVRCRYRALVGDLARRGLIDEIPGRTTGEERAQLRRVVPAAAAPFDRAADLFDGAWYGSVAVDEADDDAFVAWERDVLAVGVRPVR